MAEPKARPARPYDVALGRAFNDALYQKLLDECWEAIQEALDDPDVAEKRRAFLKALARKPAEPDGNGR